MPSFLSGELAQRIWLSSKRGNYVRIRRTHRFAIEDHEDPKQLASMSEFIFTFHLFASCCPVTQSPKPIVPKASRETERKRCASSLTARLLVVTGLL